MEPAFSILGVQYDWWYVLTFFLGVLILLVFSLEKFDKPYPGNKYLAELFPSSLSPGRSYIKAFLIYFGVIVGIFTAACIFFGTASGIWDVFFGEGFEKRFAAPDVAQDASTSSAGAGKPVPAAIPLVLALVIVGFFPKYKQFGEVEAPLRRFAHRLIGIPQGLENQTIEIAATPLSNSRNDRGAIIRLFVGQQFYQLPKWARDNLANSLSFSEPHETTVERDRPSPTEEEKETWSLLQVELEPRLRVANKWYRARQLINRICPNSEHETKVLDVEARRKYERLRTDIRKSFNELDREIAKIADEQRKLSKLVGTLKTASGTGAIRISETDVKDVIESLEVLLQKRLDELIATEDRMDDLLGEIHLYMAASVLLKQTKVEQLQLIDAYGLVRPRLHDRRPIDDILKAVFLMVGLLFAFNYFLYHILALFSFDDQNPTLTALRLGVSALIMHGGAAIAAFSWRRRQANADQWDGSEAGSRPGIRQYVKLGAMVYLAVYLGLLLWAFVAVALSSKTPASQNPLLAILSDTDLIIAYAVLSLSTVVTAICATLYVDYAERSQLDNKSMAVLALIQGGLTGFIVLVSSEIIDPGNRYFILMSCLNGFVIGVTLGAAILKLASKRKAPSGSLAPVLLSSPNN